MPVALDDPPPEAAEEPVLLTMLKTRSICIAPLRHAATRVVHLRAQQKHHSLAVESTVGVGSTFTIRLPRTH